jgi:mannitol/fructose-specific phosphotransferase system IIA component (Ntr-type)
MNKKPQNPSTDTPYHTQNPQILALLNPPHTRTDHQLTSLKTLISQNEFFKTFISENSEADLYDLLRNCYLE